VKLYPKLWQMVIIQYTISLIYLLKLLLGDELCGLSVGSRWNSDIIQIWNVNSDCAAQSNIMEVVQKALPTVKFQASYYKGKYFYTFYSNFTKLFI
jgi:hypothetical protein